MRWYLLIGMIIFFSTAAPMQSASNFVPLLECEQDPVEDMDDLFMRMSQPTMQKIPRWQMIVQQWGSLLVAHVLRFKEYANDQYEKIKMIMYAMLYRNNPVAKK